MEKDYDVCMAEDGEKGVLMASSENPDLILMDLSLPIKDSWTATSEIKSNPSTESVPIIVLTARYARGWEKSP